MQNDSQQCDVAIIGGGPAGLQAALMLARTRKRVIVFDSPEPPRNARSHGVHNMLGLDGLLPAQIREQAWQQIDIYGHAERWVERITDIQPLQSAGEHRFIVQGEAGTQVTAVHVVLAIGYRDIYPDVPGFLDCWGETIIPCPFCDGYENRSRVWGLVATNALALEHMPHLFRNWTATGKLIVSASVDLTADMERALTNSRIPIYHGEIVRIDHEDGRVQSVVLDSGERVEVETLWWRPEEAALPLTRRVIETFALDIDEAGYIKSDVLNQTSVKGLWAVGDVRGWAGALGAAFAAHQAAIGIVRDWSHGEMGGTAHELLNEMSEITGQAQPIL